MQFCNDKPFEAYYASDLGSKRTNDKFKCWKIILSVKILFFMKMYITVAPRYNKLLYNEVLGIRNYFLTPVMVKYMAI